MSFWQAQFHRRLRKAIRKGRIEIIYPDGATHCYGEPCAAPLRVRITTRSWLRRLTLDPAW